MDFALDHLLHAVNDPYDVRRTFEDRFSWHGVSGGEHPDWGTYNELCYFGLSYIEWIGINNFLLAARSRFGREVLRGLSVGEGVGQFALRTHDIDAVAARWAEQGLPFWGPVDGSRVRLDGSVIRWRLLFPGQGDPEEFALPFVIDWGNSDKERQDSLQTSDLVFDQDGGLKLVTIHSIVRNLDSLRGRWEKYFGPLLPDIRESEEDGRVLEGELGDIRLAFYEPVNLLLQDELTRHGERPVQIDIAPLDLLSQERMISVRQGSINPELDILHGLRVQVFKD